MAMDKSRRMKARFRPAKVAAAAKEAKEAKEAVLVDKAAVLEAKEAVLADRVGVLADKVAVLEAKVDKGVAGLEVPVGSAVVDSAALAGQVVEPAVAREVPADDPKLRSALRDMPGVNRNPRLRLSRRRPRCLCSAVRRKTRSASI